MDHQAQKFSRGRAMSHGRNTGVVPALEQKL
jgi:hypothetical protein